MHDALNQPDTTMHNSDSAPIEQTDQATQVGQRLLEIVNEVYRETPFGTRLLFAAMVQQARIQSDERLVRDRENAQDGGVTW